MKYHQPSKSFVVETSQIESVADDLKYLLSQIRKLGGRPMTKYDALPMNDADHAQCTVMDIAKSLGIDLGADRYNKLDLTDKSS